MESADPGDNETIWSFSLRRHDGKTRKGLITTEKVTWTTGFETGIQFWTKWSWQEVTHHKPGQWSVGIKLWVGGGFRHLRTPQRWGGHEAGGTLRNKCFSRVYSFDPFIHPAGPVSLQRPSRSASTLAPRWVKYMLLFCFTLRINTGLSQAVMWVKFVNLNLSVGTTPAQVKEGRRRRTLWPHTVAKFIFVANSGKTLPNKRFTIAEDTSALVIYMHQSLSNKEPSVTRKAKI